MTNLKTLKDLGFHWSYYRELRKPFKKLKQKAYDEDELKAEAIKWVKYYKGIKYNEPNYAKRRIQIQWIKEFFNLTEEDLK